MAGMENLKVLVVHPVSSVRHMLLDVLKNRGITDIQAVAGGEEAIHFLEVEHVDWLIAPFDLGENINTLKILNLLRSETSLRQLRVSLLYDPTSENQYLPLAFALGLFSCHINNYVRDDLERSFDQIFFLDRLYSGEASLVSSFFLRLHLIETKNYQDLLKLDQTYLSLFPGSTFVLSNLVESLAYSGQKDLASSLAQQIQLIDKRAGQLLAKKMQKLGVNANGAKSTSTQREDVLKLHSVVVVDPDTDVLFAIKNLLTDAGVKSVETFETGSEAMDWLTANPPPKLFICEWRIPDLPGPFLIQRLRQARAFDTLTLVCSSLVGPEDRILLREIGVDDVLEKPFDSQIFFKTIVSVMQEHVRPTEQKSLHAKIIRAIDMGRLGEAERLLAHVILDVRIEAAVKLELQAEFDFANQKLDDASRKALQALEKSQGSISALNLLGKIFLHKKDYEMSLKFFEKAQAQSPKNIDRLIAMSQIHLNKDDIPAAQSAVDRAKSLDGTNEAVAEHAALLKLSAGDVSASRHILSSLDKGERFIAAMNARAIALVHRGRFDDGIKLYEDALNVIPASWKEKRAAVMYNLGLAYSRYGDLEMAAKHLQGSLKSSSKELVKKASHLLTRVEQASTKGIKLQITDLPLEGQQQDIDASSQKGSKQYSGPSSADLKVWVEKLEITRGDLNCFLLYPVNEVDLTKYKNVLLPPLKFLKRDPLVREVTLTRG
jgi:CheY-like chemotaxis protein